MKPKTATPRRGDASLLDLLFMLIAVAVVVMVFFPMVAKRTTRSSRIGCVNNLKQVGLSFRWWLGDNDDKFPAQVSTNAGGVKELVASGAVYPHFVAISNELGTPKILLCPHDAARLPATNFVSLRDTNISYFVVPEADETIPEMWLSGDRNLATNTVPLKAGLFLMPTNRVMSWTAQLHQHGGNVVFADGSVQQLNSRKLHESATNALGAYYATNAPRAYYGTEPKVTFRLAIP